MLKNTSFILSLLFISSTALSISAWEGTRYIYSSSPGSNKIFRIDLRQRTTGATVFINGSKVHGLYEVKGDKLEITFDAKDPLKSPNSLLAEQPITGESIVVLAEDRVQKIVLSGTFEAPIVKEFGLTCVDLETEDENIPVISQCIELERKNDEETFVFIKELQNLSKKNIDINSTEYVFIKTTKNGALEPLDQNEISSIKQENGKITLDLNDESTLTLNVRTEVDGVNRLVGVKTRNNKDIDLINLIAVKVALSDFTPEGSYKPISYNGKTRNVHLKRLRCYRFEAIKLLSNNRYKQ